MYDNNMDEIETCVPVGKVIRYRRKSLGLTCKELAKKAGVSEKRLNDIEDDLDYDNLLLGTLIKIAEGLDTSVYKLVKLAEENSYEINPNMLDGPGSEDYFFDDNSF